MDKYQEADRRLFELFCIKGLGSLPLDDSIGPKWTRDDAAAFQLMVKHNVMHSILGSTQEGYGLWVQNPFDDAHLIVYYDEHPDKATATRYAIVQAVIAKLEK